MADSIKPFILERTFEAPRALVWDAFTKAEHLKHWMGPSGSLSHASIDLKPGGIFHYGMALPNGQTMWGKWTFREIVPQEKLVVVVSFSDANKGVTRHPMSADWPQETLSTTTFTESGGKTTIRMAWSAINATEKERDTFDASRDSMTTGWKGTYDALDAYLKSLRH